MYRWTGYISISFLIQLFGEFVSYLLLAVYQEYISDFFRLLAGNKPEQLFRICMRTHMTQGLNLCLYLQLLPFDIDQFYARLKSSTKTGGGAISCQQNRILRKGNCIRDMVPLITNGSLIDWSFLLSSTV